jgi:dTDP-L-rhamnose 4-epimerase
MTRPRHLTRHLLALGHEITILDNFLHQVHAGVTTLPHAFADDLRLIAGDIADPAVLERALERQHCVVHYAAETGTAQSMYELSRYERTNVAGTALLYELLSKMNHKVGRVVAASSRAIYGEGAYHCEANGLVYPRSRTARRSRQGNSILNALFAAGLARACLHLRLPNISRLRFMD